MLGVKGGVNGMRQSCVMCLEVLGTENLEVGERRMLD
jgi:hypothetical protein